MKPHKGIPFNAVDAANNINGTKTRHLIRVGKAIQDKALDEWSGAVLEGNPISLKAFKGQYLNKHAPYKPGDVVYQKEKIINNWYFRAVFEDGEFVRVKGDKSQTWHIVDLAAQGKANVPRTQMKAIHARLWLQIASCTAVQVDEVWMWEITYSKTEKP